MPLEIGTKAPEVTALNQDGVLVDFGQLYKKGIVLVYFYPKAGTPGCTMQACRLRDSFKELAARGIIIVGVSLDKIETQRNFKEKYKLPFILIADVDRKVIKAFGVATIPLIKIVFRQSFLIRDGVVFWRDLRVSVKQHVNDVKNALSILGC